MMSYSEQMIDSRAALEQMYEYHDGDRRMKKIEVPSENPYRIDMEKVIQERMEKDYSALRKDNNPGHQNMDNFFKGNDLVNNPSHYNTGEVECIDGIKAALSEEEYRGYLRGAAMKYLWRCTYKGKMKEDLSKAEWYINKLKEGVVE